MTTHDANQFLGGEARGHAALYTLPRLAPRFGASLPAVIVSGDTTPEIFKLAREQRLPVLSKPVRAARLRAALQHLFSGEREAAGDTA